MNRTDIPRYVDYSDKYVLITGAAHGIGAAFANILLRAVALYLDIEKEKLAAVVAELPNSERHRIFDIDIGKTDQCEALFRIRGRGYICGGADKQCWYRTLQSLSTNLGAYRAHH